MIYFDHAATCGRRPEDVTRAILHALEETAANPGRSGHRRSLEAARLLEDSRAEIASLVHAPDAANLILTKNATEGINIALFGLLRPGDAVLAGRFEHNAVMRPLRHLERERAVRIDDLPGEVDRPVDLDALERLLRARPGVYRLLALAAASNVTGTTMPIGEVGMLCRRFGVLLVVDAAQGGGRIDLDVERDAIDALVLTGHKSLMGPPGTGALWLRDPSAVSPWLHGGTGSRSDSQLQPDFPPDKFEAGTVNLPGFAGLAAGIRHLRRTGIEQARALEGGLLRRAWSGLSGIPGVRLQGSGDPARQLAIVSFTVSGWEGGRIARELDLHEICCRQGLHCAPRAHETLGTLAEGGTVRWSFSCTNTAGEIDEAIRVLREILGSRPTRS